jgi:hypothetical protein
MWPLRSYFCVDKCLHGPKEGDKEGYRERVRERVEKREQDGEWVREKYRKHNLKGEATTDHPIGEGLG